MQAISQGDLERAIYDLEKHFKVDYDGKTNRECIEELRKLCPQLHSEKELRTFAENLIKAIEDRFGYKGLRVWYRVAMKYAFFGHEMLSMKYYKLLDDIKEFVNEYRINQGLTLKLDVFITTLYIQDYYKKKYGVLNEDYLDDLYSILRTIHLMGYDEDLIESLQDVLELCLIRARERYYLNKDLKKVEIIKELYEYVGEEFGDDDNYQGMKLFYDFDGYGGTYLNI